MRNFLKFSIPNSQFSTPIQSLFQHKLLAVLLDALEKDGFPLGTGSHLHIQQLLASLPKDTEPEDLKTLLAPILTNSPESQERFYELFDQSQKTTEQILGSLGTVRGKPLSVSADNWKEKYLPI